MFLDKLINDLKAQPRTIVFPEGPDYRILEAAARLNEDTFLKPILVGNVDEIKAVAAEKATTSRALRSSTPPPIPRWTPWWRRWWNCARAR